MLAAVLGLTAEGTKLVAGPSVVEFVAPEAAGGEGLCALDFEVSDRGALVELCARIGITMPDRGQDVVIERGRAHGAQLRFRHTA